MRAVIAEIDAVELSDMASTVTSGGCAILPGVLAEELTRTAMTKDRPWQPTTP